MQPYTVSENEWISSIPLTPAGSIDIVALESAARREQARQLGALFTRLARRWRDRAQAAPARRQVERAAVGVGR